MTFAVHIDWTLDRSRNTAIDVKGSDTVGKLRDKVGKTLKLKPADLGLYFEGDELDDDSVRMTKTLLVEGSTVEVRPSKKFDLESSRKELLKLGLLMKRKLKCKPLELREKVIEQDKLAPTDDDKARIAQLMIDCDPDLEVGEGLWAAANAGHLEATKVLAAACKDINYPAKFKYSGGCTITPLLLASWKSHPEVVKVLLDHGADVNFLNGDGSTPIFGPCMNNNTDILNMLLEKGADVNVVTKKST